KSRACVVFTPTFYKVFGIPLILSGYCFFVLALGHLLAPPKTTEKMNTGLQKFHGRQSSSASRLTAGAFGFLTFTQWADRHEQFPAAWRNSSRSAAPHRRRATWQTSVFKQRRKYARRARLQSPIPRS